MYSIDTDAAARDQPRDQRVRVPHLARPKLVPPPDRRRHLGHELEDALREQGVICQPLRTLDGIAEVWDHAIAPASDFVSEDAHRPHPSGADCALRNDTA
jgi:hypothetical protein